MLSSISKSISRIFISAAAEALRAAVALQRDRDQSAAEALGVLAEALEQVAHCIIVCSLVLHGSYVTLCCIT